MTGVLDIIIDPAIDSIKKLLKIDQNSYNKPQDSSTSEEKTDPDTRSGSGFNLDNFISEKLSLDASKLDVDLGSKKSSSQRNVWRSSRSIVSV